VSLEANKAVVRRFVDEVVSEGRLEVLEEVVHPDYVDHAPDPGQVPGFEGFRQSLVALRRAFPDFHSFHEQMVAEGDMVAYREISRATHRGEFHGIAATGRRVEVEEMHIVRIADGKIAEHWALYDTLGMLRQLGALPDPSQTGG
jgi:predicted ester cyclase